MHSFKNYLALDGGGSKGVYTLAILEELEKSLGDGKTLSSCFDNFYGTSTGSIIATWAALGWPISELKDKYFELIPKVMKPLRAKARSKALSEELESFFGNESFKNIKSNLAIVSSDFEQNKPRIFKVSVDQAHGSKGSFEPGWGAKLSDAVEASCSAYPFFRVKAVKTNSLGTLNLVDGGYVANNPTLVAYIDAKGSLKTGSESKILSVGTGNFVEAAPFRQGITKLHMIGNGKLLSKLFDFSVTSQEQYLKLINQDEMDILRINETFNSTSTNLFEKKRVNLEKLYRLGKETFNNKEKEIKSFLGIL